MFGRRSKEEQALDRTSERQLEETRRRQARVLAQLKVLTYAVENMIPEPGKERREHGTAH